MKNPIITVAILGFLSAPGAMATLQSQTVLLDKYIPGSAIGGGVLSVVASQDSGNLKQIKLEIQTSGLLNNAYVDRFMFNSQYAPVGYTYGTHVVNAIAVSDQAFMIPTTYKQDGTVKDPNPEYLQNGIKSEGDGWFDVDVAFNNDAASRLDINNNYEITISYADNYSLSDFIQELSDQKGGNSEFGYTFAAHVAGFNGNSALFVGTGTAVPEASTLVAGLGALGALLLGARRMRK